MSQPLASSYHSLQGLARNWPGQNGKPIHPVTLTRYIVDGVKLPDGSRLYLRAVRFPAGWMIPDEAVHEFLDTLTASFGGKRPESKPKTANGRVGATAVLKRAVS